MQEVYFDQPYKFIPPVKGPVWPYFLKRIVRPHLRRHYQVNSQEFRGLEHYQESIRAGHGVLLAPNHCRPCDPVTVGSLVPELGHPVYMMASWHLFKQSRFQGWLIRRAGAFSVYREGLDKQSISAAIDMLVQAQRPLVIFPEGAVTRTNDVLQPLQEGTIFIARNAARRRDKAGRGKVVIHPVVSKYVFRGDLEASLTPVLASMETQLGWRPQDETPLVPRVFNLGNALITLKELRYLGHPREGKLSRRAAYLIGQILAPLEEQYPVPRNGGDGVLGRVKRLSAVILQPLVHGDPPEEERQRRWRQLTDLYVAQQLANYPTDYVTSNPTPERVLETVERFDEDLHDYARVHGPLHVIISIGPAIEVEPIRVRNGADPLMETLRARLQEGIDALVSESGPPLPLYDSADETVEAPSPRTVEIP